MIQTESANGMHLPMQVSYDCAIARVTAALKQEGFGVLTEIDAQATLKKKLDVDFQRYVILGACNPSHAWTRSAAIYSTSRPSRQIPRHRCRRRLTLSPS